MDRLNKQTSAQYPHIGGDDTQIYNLLAYLPPYECDETACYVYGRDLEKESLAISSFRDFLLSERDPSKIYIVVAAVGAGETWGCFPAGTRIRTINGDIAINDVKKDEEVYTHNGVKRITKKFQRLYADDMYYIYLNGIVNPIVCTDNHPIRIFDNGKEAWKEASLINNSDRVVINLETENINSIPDWIVKVYANYIKYGEVEDNEIVFKNIEYEIADSINSINEIDSTIIYNGDHTATVKIFGITETIEKITMSDIFRSSKSLKTFAEEILKISPYITVDDLEIAKTIQFALLYIGIPAGIEIEDGKYKITNQINAIYLNNHKWAVKVDRTHTTSSRQIVYNISVEDSHSYILSDNFAIVKNCNNNGDFIPRKELIKAYKTFENNNVYVEHINKDPRLRVGKVLKAEYDNKMDRVLLLLEIDPDRAPSEAIRDLEMGHSVAVSMGMTPAYDVCSICGNMAASSVDYCKHLRPTYICRVCGHRTESRDDFCEHMKKDPSVVVPYRRHILEYDPETGSLVYMINYGIKFHDISLVSVPAEKDAWALYKFDGDKAQMLKYQFGIGKRPRYKPPEPIMENEKVANVIEMPPRVRAIKLIILGEPVIDDDVMRYVHGTYRDSLIPTMSAMGMMLRPCEFNAIPDIRIPSDVSEYRRRFDPFLARLLMRLVMARSYFSPFMIPRIRQFIASDRYAFRPFDEPVDVEKYANLIDAQWVMMNDISEKETTPAADVLSDVIEKTAGGLGLGKWALAGAIAPAVYAGYKTTTAKSQDDIDWITKKVYENPLGAALTGAALFTGGGIGAKLLHGKISKLTSGIKKTASENEHKYVETDVEPMVINEGDDIYSVLEKRANQIIEKLQK